MCDCIECTKSRERRGRIDLLPEQDRAYFEELIDYLLEVEYDLQFKKAILDGSWPGAEQILQKALNKIKEKQK